MKRQTPKQQPDQMSSELNAQVTSWEKNLLIVPKEKKTHLAFVHSWRHVTGGRAGRAVVGGRHQHTNPDGYFLLALFCLLLLCWLLLFAWLARCCCIVWLLSKLTCLGIKLHEQNGKSSNDFLRENGLFFDPTYTTSLPYPQPKRHHDRSVLLVY